MEKWDLDGYPRGDAEREYKAAWLAYFNVVYRLIENTRKQQAEERLRSRAQFPHPNCRNIWYNGTTHTHGIERCRERRSRMKAFAKGGGKGGGGNNPNYPSTTDNPSGGDRGNGPKK